MSSSSTTSTMRPFTGAAPARGRHFFRVRAGSSQTAPAEGRLLFRLRARVAGVRGDRRGRAPGGEGAPPGGTHGGQDPERPSGTRASSLPHGVPPGFAALVAAGGPPPGAGGAAPE